MHKSPAVASKRLPRKAATITEGLMPKRPPAVAPTPESKHFPRKRENKVKGFVCPWCPGEPLLYVNHTELAAPGIIRRNRRCLICGETKVTEERESK